MTCGCVLAMTLSVEEAEKDMGREDGSIAWGVGCHPMQLKWQSTFEAKRFRAMVEGAAIIGEVGLDGGSRVPKDVQLSTFRAVLEAASDMPRLVSIHSYGATREVLGELRRTPIAAPVLHWWTGSAEETEEAADLGCYFSVHSAVARHSKFRTRVPRERILLETDHGWRDPPAAIPLRIGWVEHLAAQQFRMDVMDLRRLAWANFADIMRKTGTLQMLPAGLREHVPAAGDA